MPRSPLLSFDGHILGAAFSSGDRFVVGRWHASPFGGFADLMWSRPDGTRVLVVERDDVRRFVSHHYRFERAVRGAVTVERTGDRIDVVVPAVGLELSLHLGPPDLLGRLLRLRPGRLRTSPSWIAVEDRLLRPLVAPLLGGGVRTRGRTAAGAREWYGIAARYPARSASATLAGRGLGPPVRTAPSASFGFSEFPASPGLVRVTALIEPGPSVGAGNR